MVNSQRQLPTWVLAVAVVLLLPMHSLLEMGATVPAAAGVPAPVPQYQLLGLRPDLVQQQQQQQQVVVVAAVRADGLVRLGLSQGR
jgi:hypothetical protein